MAISERELVEYQDDDEPQLDEQQPEKPPFKITGVETADWALGKLAYYQRRMAENVELYETKMMHLDEWRERVNKPLQASAEYFENLLLLWHIEMFQADKKRKSIPLPNGTLSSTQCNDKAVIVDEAAFLASAPPELIKEETTRKPVSKTDILKYITETGESIPGVKVEPGLRQFKVKADK